MLPEKVLRELREERAVGGGDGKGNLISKMKRECCTDLAGEEEEEVEEEGRRREGRWKRKG